MKSNKLREVMLIWLIGLVAFSAHTQEISRPLKIMSFNIRNSKLDEGANSWQNRKDILFSLIKNSDPDIIGMQEVTAEQRSELEEHFSNYATYGRGRSADGGDEETTIFVKKSIAILDRGIFWFSETPKEAGSRYEGEGLPRICTWVKLKRGGHVFFVYNVHLSTESWATEKSAKFLVEKISEISASNPAFLLGDFNQGETSKTIKTLVDAGFIDSYRQIRPEEEERWTFHDFCGHDYWAWGLFWFEDPSRYDYIFYRDQDEITVQNAQIIEDSADGGYPSDHYPIISTFQLK